MIRIGCSGWSYPEWVGPFYPSGTRDKLQYYSRVFSTVEVNSSFYGDIPQLTVRSWVKKYSGSGFRFSVKAPRTLTHRSLSDGTDQALLLVDKFLEDLVWPLRDSGILGMTLFQIPPFFGLDEILNLASVLGESDLAGIRPRVEIRNKDLLRREVLDKVFHGTSIMPVIPDSPDLTVDSGIRILGRSDYLRLHGRNRSKWSAQGSGMSRYDYLYSTEEMQLMAEEIRKLDSGDDIFVYFNNHPGGKATKNAISLIDILGSEDRRAKLF